MSLQCQKIQKEVQVHPIQQIEKIGSINTNRCNKIEDIKEVLGTLTKEVAHGKDALEGRQDKKVAEDKSNDEESLETLGRPANEYVKKKFGEDNNSKIKLTTDGIDLSNADVGEKGWGCKYPR